MRTLLNAFWLLGIIGWFAACVIIGGLIAR